MQGLLLLVMMRSREASQMCCQLTYVVICKLHPASHDCPACGIRTTGSKVPAGVPGTDQAVEDSLAPLLSVVDVIARTRCFLHKPLHLDSAAFCPHCSHVGNPKLKAEGVQGLRSYYSNNACWLACLKQSNVVKKHPHAQMPSNGCWTRHVPRLPKLLVH